VRPRRRAVLVDPRLSSIGKPLVPFLKWPGGKRWAAERISEIVRHGLRGTYFEPFLGGAAVFFHLRPDLAVLSDLNRELVAAYQAVRDRVDEVLRELGSLRVNRRRYLEVREATPADPITRAARFLYLNRTGFGGIYRVNGNGKFNVPYGGGDRTPRILTRTSRLADASVALLFARLECSDFEPMLDCARQGDVVYCDPIYTVTHDNNCFVRYNERNFSWSDQERLAKVARRTAARGVRVIISNAHHDEVRKLYRGLNRLTLVRFSSLSADPLRRRAVKEHLILL